MMISIVNYEMGNIGSILNMLKRIGAEANVVTTADEIIKAKKILLPGVGAFDAAMEKIHLKGIKESLDEMALVKKVPVLGICLGMQLLTGSSEEGKQKGLGWIPAETLGFRSRVDTNQIKVPHMGWSSAKSNNLSPLTLGFEKVEDLRFYFVHSYFVRCQNPSHVVLKSNYGLEFDSAVQVDNIFGAQFHPEKSHKFGMMLLENFARI